VHGVAQFQTLDDQPYTPMNKYILINHGSGTAGQWDTYLKMLHEGGHILGGSSLDHGIAVQNGIFTDAVSTTITGYILIQAHDIEIAKKIALQSPVQLSGGVVEVFTLSESE